MPSMISITSTRSSSAMRGASSMTTVASSTRWCSTRLCLTNCVSANGTPWARTPGTRRCPAVLPGIG